MFPIRDTIPSRHVPVATWLIISVSVVVFLLELANPARVVPHDTFSTGGIA
jgi:hypothetical protein